MTPSAFLESVAAQLDRLHGHDAEPVLLRGIPLQAGSGKVSSGLVYAEVRDPHTQDGLAARVPELIADRLERGREAGLVGLIHYTVRRGELRPEFRVDDVREAGALRLPTKDELLQRWSEAVTRPRRDVRAALRKEKPRVVLVTGVGSVAADDVRAQLREAEADLHLEVVRVSMHDPGLGPKAVPQAKADFRTLAVALSTHVISHALGDPKEPYLDRDRGPIDACGRLLT